MPRALRIPLARPFTAAFAVAVVSLLAIPATPLAAQDVDLSGDWILTVESPNGTGTRDVTFLQEDGELTGTIASSRAAGPLEGFVEGDRVEFVAVVAMETGNFEITYMARVENGILVEGIVDFGEYGSGTFTGRRKEG